MSLKSIDNLEKSFNRWIKTHPYNFEGYKRKIKFTIQFFDEQDIIDWIEDNTKIQYQNITIEEMNFEKDYFVVEIIPKEVRKKVYWYDEEL